ncbi:reverse transcriptase domain-containing protein [Tanacetum coccineum]
MIAHHYDWDTSAQRGESSTTSSSSKIAALAQQMVEMRKDMLQMFRSNQQVNYVSPRCETYGRPHSYFECQDAGGYTQDVYATTGNYNSGGILTKALQERPHGALPSNTIPNPREEIKAITTRSGIVLAGPSVPPPPLSSSSKGVERDRKQSRTRYFSKVRLNKEKLQDKSDIQVHKFLQMEKLLGLANTSLTKNCLAVLLKKLPEKFRDPRKFLIPCDFPELEKCMALADLGASINLMPLSVWNKLMLLELVPICMTLELANRSIAYPAGIAEDVFVQVGKFTFPADFIVVYYDVDPRVPLILGRPFLMTAHALVDVHREELILRDGDEN